MSWTWRFRVCRCVWLTLIVSLCGGQMQGQPCVATDTVPIPPDSKVAMGRPIKIIAFGTSLMWGNGLKDANTFRYLVGRWIAKETGRPVILTTFAHSAALLGVPKPGTGLEGDANWVVGDLNYSVPAVHQQIDCAAGLPGTTDPDLILLEGCINEVGAETIPLPWTDPDDIKQRTHDACGEMMQAELIHLAQVYPRPLTIVMSYFPLVSDQSIVGWFRGTQRLKKHAKKVYAARHATQPVVPAAKHSNEDDRNKMASNSEVFYQASKQELSTAIDYVNTSVVHRQQMIFAPLPEVTLPNGTRTVNPNFAFGAPEHKLWWIPIPIVWHWAFFADQKYGIRHDECGEYVTRLEERIICPVNNAFHPNAAGAKMYADSITAVIPADTVSQWKAAGEQAGNP